MLALTSLGCGTVRMSNATDQILLSDAVDRSVADVDFRALSDEKVYLDTQYLLAVKGMGFVNAPYIISSVRQQMVAANCLLQEKLSDADYVVEIRVGALGLDGHDVSYGIPKSNLLPNLSSVVAAVPPLPAIPEISVGRRASQSAAAKIGVFAYHRSSRKPVWQAGVSVGESTAKSTWVLGMGPFQRGTIYEHTQLAGSELKLPSSRKDRRGELGLVKYQNEHLFPTPLDSNEPARIAVSDAKQLKPQKSKKIALTSATEDASPPTPPPAKRPPRPDGPPALRPPSP